MVAKLQDFDLLVIHDAATIVVGKVRDINVIENLYKVCHKEGFHDLNIAYLGGDWVWIEFKKQITRIKFKQCTSLQEYFSELKPLQKNFVMGNHIIWVKVVGLPLCALAPSFFKKVASKWRK